MRTLIHVGELGYADSQCITCNTLLPVSCFPSDPRRKKGYQSECKICKRNRLYSLQCTRSGFLSKLINGAHGSQRKRYKKKGLVPPTFNLTVSCLQKLYEQQGRTGYYSNIPLTFQPLSDWQASIDRLDPHGDYVDGNIALDGLEFNGPSQWSLDKIMKIPSLVRTPNIVTLDDIQSDNMRRKQTKRLKSTNDKATRSGECLYCHSCNEWKVSDQFYGFFSTRCRMCHTKRTTQHKSSLYGFLKHLLSNAKRSSKHRALRSTDLDDRDRFELALDDMFQMLIQQNFRCKYSNIPMTFGILRDWRISLERVDNSRGYTTDNCVLICREFNTSDWSFSAKNPVCGSAQWSEEKFQYFYNIRYEG
eukprot:820668_1